MLAANVKVLLSRESMKQSFIQELLNRGITETKDGARIEDLDYYSLRQEVIMARFREVDVGSSENGWF